ncbi:hypothetical protein [Parafrankia sp. EUN1f]|uniref:hypothetical protein n=1 Tax=Parafrankia sp. EUN1f TaxID=102897 RepID=UPI0001C474D2|nr:hypothetical protein [Parafrankia sp. EUN1f]EFC79766.1 hypothetical protein FrEUN1fDRAFT_7122 [Parafrankia sp. EUN1f]
MRPRRAGETRGLPAGADRKSSAGAGHKPPCGLEVTYRRLLRCYPRRWREARGEEFLATLLECAEAAGRTRPDLPEVLDLVAHGLAARCGIGTDLVPSPVRQRIATLALALGAAFALVLLVIAEREPANVLRMSAWPANARPFPGQAPGPSLTTGPLVFIPWLLAFVAALARRRRVMRLLLLSTYPATWAVLALGAWGGLMRPPLAVLGVLAVLAVPAFAGAAAPRLGPGPGPGRDRGSGGLLPATGLVLGWLVLLAAFGNRFWWVSPDRGSVARFRLPYGYWNGSFVDAIADTLPQALLFGAGVGLIVGIRRPGWVVAVFGCGLVLTALPVWHAWVQRWGFADHLMQIALTLVLLLSAALIDGMRAWRVTRRQAVRGSTAGVEP